MNNLLSSLSLIIIILQAYDNNQSSVRKASVICLVAVYMSVGEDIRPYLQDLHGSKVDQSACLFLGSLAYDHVLHYVAMLYFASITDTHFIVTINTA